MKLEKALEILKNNDERKTAQTYVVIKHIAIECMEKQLKMEEHDKQIREESYNDGFYQGATAMEETKQIIIDSLLKQMEKIRANVIDEFVKAIEKHQTRQDSYLEPPYIEMGLDMTDVLEVAEQLKENK